MDGARGGGCGDVSMRQTVRETIHVTRGRRGRREGAESGEVVERWWRDGGGVGEKHGVWCVMGV